MTKYTYNLLAIGLLIIAFIGWIFWSIYAPPSLSISPQGVEHLKGSGIEVTYDPNSEGTSSVQLDHLTMASIELLQQRLEINPQSEAYKTAM